jgi:hypothetical protein
MSRFLLCLLIAASIVPHLLLAQQKPNPQLVEAAWQRAARMGDIVMGQEVTSHISTYEKKENTNSYELTSTKREGKNVMVRDGKEMKLPLEDNSPETTEGEYNRVTIYNHESTIYLKEEMRSTMQGLSKQPLPFEGVYEATVIEGSWEGSQKGEKLVLRHCASCKERYAGDISKYLKNPPRLFAIEQEFRKKYIAMHEKIVAEKAFLLTLGRLPTDGELSDSRSFIQRTSLEEFTLSLFNLNEFVHID